MSVVTIKPATHVADRNNAPTANGMLAGPILPTPCRSSLPNMLAMLAMALVTIAETTYVGRLGTPPLAGLALVFPLVMLQQMLSGGAVGGGVSSAISRALGAGDEQRASSLAFQAVIIGVAFGAISTIAMMGFGEPVYRLLGGRDAALTSEALIYSNVVFFGAVGIWLTNMLAAVIRAGGNMRVPSVAMVSTSVAQVVLGGALGFGLGVGGMSFPRLGMAGIALGQVLAYSGCALFFVWYLTSPYARILLSLRNASLRWDHIRDILRVGALASISPVQSIFIALILTRLVASFGTVTGRLRHRDAPGVPADPSVIRCRRDVRLDGRHGDRGRQCCARTPRRMDWRRLRSAIGRHDRTDRSCLA